MGWIAKLVRSFFGPKQGPGPDPPVVDSTPLAPDPDPDPDAAEVARLIGARRGGPPPPIDARLNRAAQAHAEDMDRRNYFRHESPHGVWHSDRVRSVGYPNLTGEVLAWNYPTPATVVDGWMRSPGHRRILMHPDAVAIGSGVSGPYRVALVGMRGAAFDGSSQAPVGIGIDLVPPGIR